MAPTPTPDDVRRQRHPAHKIVGVKVDTAYPDAPVTATIVVRGQTPADVITALVAAAAAASAQLVALEAVQ